MNRTATDIAKDLDRIREEDFDLMRVESDGIERLRQLCDELGYLPVGTVGPMLFHLMERLDSCDLGSPGPIVHTLESLIGYESFLVKSVERKPTPLTVWMVNRIANVDRPDRPMWLDLLKRATVHVAATEETKAQALEFLEFQNES